MPSADQTISTTRITMPDNPTAFLANANANRIVPEHPHWPLVFVTVLMQTVMGVLCFVAPSRHPQPILMTVLLVIVQIALTLSTLHLGRPAFAWRALKMWRRSWLSREVLVFTLFTGALTADTAVHWLLSFFLVPAAFQHYFPHIPTALSAVLPTLLPILNWTSLALAILGTLASSGIYLIKARPAWNTLHTPIDFLVTGLLAGSVLFRLIGGYLPVAPQYLAYAAPAIQGAALLWIANFAIRILRMHRSSIFELQATSKLLVGTLRKELFVGASTTIAGLFLSHSGMVPLACAVILFGALVLRYLFFVSVVPKNMALTFLTQESAH
jgi:DMSO reductase anchor subunit